MKFKLQKLAFERYLTDCHEHFYTDRSHSAEHNSY